MYGKDLENVSRFEIKERYEDCAYLYGGEDYIITADDLIALSEGKILNSDVNWEYGFTLKLSDNARQLLIAYIQKENSNEKEA